MAPFTKGLPQTWVLLGTLLCDLIDKPLYYSLAWLTGKTGTDLGLISGTRTFGHSALFALGFALAAAMRKSKILAAITLGVCSHLLLDKFTDILNGYYQPNSQPKSYAETSALLWPFTGSRFPEGHFHSLMEHVSSLDQNWMLYSEILGLAVLLWTTLRQPILRNFFGRKK